MESVLSSLGKDVLTEDTKKAILDAFNEAVDTKVQERIDLEIKTALDKQDEEHAAKAEQLIEAVDSDHAIKLEMVVNAINEDHTEKGKQIVAKYEKIINEEAVKFRNYLITEISNYMELALDKTIPVKEITEAAQNSQSRRLVDEIKKIVSLDEEYVTNEIRDAMKDAKSQIETLRGDMNTVIKENVKLNQDLKSTASKLLLAESTAGLPDSKKQYVLRVLADKSPEFIKENFDYVVKMAEKEEADKSETLVETAKKETKTVTNKVDTPPLAESAPAQTSVEDSETAGYLEELQRA